MERRRAEKYARTDRPSLLPCVLLDSTTAPPHSCPSLAASFCSLHSFLATMNDSGPVGMELVDGLADDVQQPQPQPRRGVKAEVKAEPAAVVLSDAEEEPAQQENGAFEAEEEEQQQAEDDGDADAGEQFDADGNDSDAARKRRAKQARARKLLQQKIRVIAETISQENREQI